MLKRAADCSLTLESIKSVIRICPNKVLLRPWFFSPIFVEVPSCLHPQPKVHYCNGLWLEIGMETYRIMNLPFPA